MTHSVLLVDDEKSVCAALKRTLRNKHYTIYEANSGDQALALLENTPVDVIISDQRMPGMNGTELLTIVKNRYPKVGRVMLSGYCDFDALTNAVNEANIFRFMAKPWDDNVLIKTVDETISENTSNVVQMPLPRSHHRTIVFKDIYSPFVPHFSPAVNDIEESFFKKQRQLEADIINDELALEELSLSDMESDDNTLHYLQLTWPRFQRFSHSAMIDIANQAGYLKNLYHWYALSCSDKCQETANNEGIEYTSSKPKKVVIDLFCEEMLSDKSLRSILLSIMQRNYHLVFRIAFSMLEKEAMQSLLKETYISQTSIMLNIGKRIIDVNELKQTPIDYLELDARYNTIRNESITQKRIAMLEDAQKLSIKTILTETTEPEQLLYAKKMNIDFFSSKLNKGLNTE